MSRIKSILKKSYFVYGAICLSLIIFSSLYFNVIYHVFCGGDNTPYCLIIPRAFVSISGIFFSAQNWIELISSGLEHPHLIIIPLISLPFTFLPAIYALYKLTKTLFFHKQGHTDLKKWHSGLILFLVALPSLITGGVMMAYIPPRFVNTTITMDMWHAEFNVPRPYLEEWALFPENPDGSGFQFMHGQAKIEGEIPFLKFNIPLKIIDPTINKNGNIEIYVRPKFRHDMKKITDDTINESLNKALASVDKNNNPIYSTSINNNGLEIYAPLPNAEKKYEFGEPLSEIIVLRNGDRAVRAFALCMPDSWCKKNDYNGRAEYSPYKEGKKCDRICSNRVISTQYSIENSFDKELISEYLNNAPQFLPFIQSFTNNKEE